MAIPTVFSKAIVVINYSNTATQLASYSMPPQKLYIDSCIAS